MLKNEIHHIQGCDDSELKIARTSKLEYRISYNANTTPKALVFIIGGFGTSANISFLDFDRQYIAKHYNVMAVSVFYHCFACRNSLDEKYNVKFGATKEDIKILKNVMASLGFKTAGGGIRINSTNFAELVALTNERIKQCKEAKILDNNLKFKLNCEVKPANKEYQNYGIMPAIDTIIVLKDIMRKFPKLRALPKIYSGDSYGGYIVHLCAKIAPWYVDGIIDNSANALPTLQYIVGRELEIPDFFIEFPHISLQCFVKNLWTRDANSPYYFSDANYTIRVLLNAQHLSLQSTFNSQTLFVSYHSAKDTGAKAKDKKSLYESYKTLGFDATLHLIRDESEVDGRFIKNLEHGMRISLKALLRRELPSMLEKLQGKKFQIQENSISYACKEKIFCFQDTDEGFELKIFES